MYTKRIIIKKLLPKPSKSLIYKKWTFVRFNRDKTENMGVQISIFFTFCDSFFHFLFLVSNKITPGDVDTGVRIASTVSTVITEVRRARAKSMESMALVGAGLQTLALGDFGEK